MLEEKEFSLLIGGKAGDGIDRAGVILGRILSRLGYNLYILRDYPSLIRGGHTFSIIRASQNRISTHKNKIDFLIALNQDTINFHQQRLKDNSVVIYDSDTVKLEAEPATVKTIGVPLTKIIKEEKATEVMRNSCLIGAFCKIAGIEWTVLEDVLRKNIAKDIDLNLKIAQRGYNEVKEVMKIEKISPQSLPLLTGNEAISLGLIKAGLKAYIAYPMTPSSPILHFLADLAKEFNLEVIHPESEIAVILMALGFAYTGRKVAVGTSGGGFCLMTEGLSFAGMAELPIVIIVGQRPGPSTGLPTYSAQTELHFIQNAGQGEFIRFIVAPGDAQEAYYWSAMALNIAWKYQIPAFILSDKNLGEGVVSFDMDIIDSIKEEGAILWDGKSEYKRYMITENGVSPLAFVPEKKAIIKVNSYEHDEFGITTEDPQITAMMQEKRLRKGKYLLEELRKYKTVHIYGDKKALVSLLCWGSNKGVCVEAGENLGLKVIQPIVLSPFPNEEFKEAMKGVKKLICVENNATGQLARLISSYGFKIDEKILKYDGRPFALDELEEKIKNLS